jgi:hypothetical protein
MVLNHIYFRRSDKGGVDYFAPESVETMHDASGHVTGARSKADGLPVEYGGGGLSFGPVYGGVVPKEMGLPVNCNVVGPEYFRTLGIPVLRGRDFGASDTEGGQKVVIINETMARRFWPDRDPLGQKLSNDRVVVGVAADSLYRSPTEPKRPFYFVPMSQSDLLRLALHVRTAGDPMPALTPRSVTVASVDPNLPLYNEETRGHRSALWPQRLAGRSPAFPDCSAC